METHGKSQRRVGIKLLVRGGKREAQGRDSSERKNYSSDKTKQSKQQKSHMCTPALAYGSDLSEGEQEMCVMDNHAGGAI